jgi:HK97 family phage portal protein
MSKKEPKTNPIIRFIGDKLGLATREDIAAMIKSSGVTQNDRPAMRQSALIGQAIPPDMKAQDFINAYTGWVYSCVNILATETSNIDLTLYKRSSQNESKVVENHRVLDLLYKVNPMYTSYLLWEATEAYLDLVGEAFWWLSGPIENPKEIWILRPDWVDIKDTRGKLISTYEYGPPGAKKEVIPYEQIIHFKDFNPRSSYRGHGPVKAGAKAIDENNFQQDYSRQFFFNSALPGGALQTDANLTEDQYGRIRDDWEAVHRGTKKAWKVAILEAGLKWQDIGISQREMDFIEGRKLTRDDVLAIFRVPKPLLTFDDVNRAAAKEARAILLENVITHKMKRIVSFLNEFLLPRYGDDSLFFDFKNPVPNDQDVQLRYYDNALKNGWLTRNEVREMENRDPIDGGDALLVPFSVQDIGAVQTEPQKAEQKKRLSMQFNVRAKPYGYFRSTMDMLTGNLISNCEKMLRSVMNKKKTKSLPMIEAKEQAEEGEIVKNDEIREQHWRTVVSRTDPREAKYKQIISELFLKQEEEVNKKIDQGLTKSMGKVKATVDDIGDFVAGETDMFAGPTMSFIRAVIEAEGIQQIQSIVADGIFYMQTPAIQKFLKKDGVKYIQAINEETADQLRNTLAEAIEKQESISQIKARVTKVYEDATGYRAERIARSEVLRATNFSTEQAYIQSGVVEAKEWLTAHDERTCPWCGPQDGKKVGLQDSFYEKGDTVIGTNDKGKKVYLTVGVGNIDYPPLHPNCRCTLVPILSSADAIKPPSRKAKSKEKIDKEIKEKVNAAKKEVKTVLKSMVEARKQYRDSLFEDE